MTEQAPTRIQKLMTRAASAVVFVAAVLAAFLGGYWASMGLFALFVAIGTDELVKLATKAGQGKPLGVLAIISALSIYGVIGLVASDVIPMSGAIWLGVLVVAIFAAQLFRNTKNAFGDAALTAASAVYVGGGFSFLLLVMCLSGAYDYTLALGLIFLIWANDTFAYLTGQFLGRNKMAPSISPNKTWEGFAGGVVFAVLTGWVISQFWDVLAPIDWMVCGGLMGVFGTAGDFLESLFKRQAGVKDSGNLMPGHGGVLDRFDGLLFALPVVYFYISRVAG